MLDTNIVTDLIRNPQGRAASKLAEHGESGICLSILVVAEMRFGLEKRHSPRLTKQAESVLSMLEVVSFDMPADVAYGRLRAHLAASGILIGSVDMFIAAHAIALGATLVTANVGEFARVPGLVVENWLA